MKSQKPSPTLMKRGTPTPRHPMRPPRGTPLTVIYDQPDVFEAHKNPFEPEGYGSPYPCPYAMVIIP